ncbi:MAG: ferrous iron transporter B, partial [Clostridia bacterium]|nr:ferrous iron transporter B [Clostridia bacterium]
ITLLEDSGLLARMCYVFDDFLTKIGLNGKAIYIMLLGLGCNTMSCMVCRNMSDKNMRKKTAIVSPYISCMARLPIYIIIASTFFGKHSYFVISALYLIGLILACLMSYILNRKKLKTVDNSLLVEFPPMRTIDIIHVVQSGKKNALDMFKRIFVTVLYVGVIIWILTHTMWNLKYTDIISDSVLFLVVEKIEFLFAPIGLNNAGIISALIVGLLAKELVLSTFSISNNVFSNKALKASLLLPTSVINFNFASAASFLIFFSIYSPCLSNLAVIKKEIGNKSMWFSLTSQLLIAYALSFVVFNLLKIFI